MFLKSWICQLLTFESGSLAYFLYYGQANWWQSLSQPICSEATADLNMLFMHAVVLFSKFCMHLNPWIMFFHILNHGNKCSEYFSTTLWLVRMQISKCLAWSWVFKVPGTKNSWLSSSECFGGDHNCYVLSCLSCFLPT